MTGSLKVPKFIGFFKMGQSRPLFVYFCPFLITISLIQIVKSIDGVLGIQTRGCRIVCERHHGAMAAVPNLLDLLKRRNRNLK